MTIYGNAFAQTQLDYDSVAQLSQLGTGRQGGAMTRATGGDEATEELYVDKEGIPHWDGENLALLREYKLRVQVEFSTQSTATDVGKEKRANLGLRLTRGLSGRAWKAVEPMLASAESIKELTQEGGGGCTSHYLGDVTLGNHRIEHLVELDSGLIAFAAFANEAGPHGVV